jgi:tripartite-type tricarboxylate transporter receptor subunit TctC
MHRITHAWLLVLALALAGASAAFAQDYPTHPIKLFVGFSPGGGLDISCRHWAQRLGQKLGQPVVVENRPGASGELAVKQVITAKPDGYTLACLSGSNTISSAKPDAPFDIRKDVAPVTQMTHFTFVLYVNPTLPVRTFPELVAYAKAHPGKLNYGSVGVGSTPHLAFEYLKLRTGIDVVHVPFKGTAQTVSAIIGGEVEVGLDAIAALKPHIDAGTIRPIAVVSTGRAPTLPNVPGMQESGFKDIDITAFSGVAAPAGTPRAIIDLLNRHLNAILQEPETKAMFAAQGYDVAGGSPEDFAKTLAADVTRWSTVVHDARIRIE